MGASGWRHRPDGAWWAASIQRLVELRAELTLRFAGVLQAQADGLWTVSGIALVVGPDTETDAGLAPGEIVAVAGHRAEDGRWLAGIRLVTAEWTHLGEDLVAGRLVHAEGRILDDGAWLAERITGLEPAGNQPFEFVGRVETLDPRRIVGIPLVVTAETQLDAQLAPGDLVRVRGEILPGGEWLAHEIRRLEATLRRPRPRPRRPLPRRPPTR
jgi:hypothetical protein